MCIYFVRHGESEANVLQVISNMEEATVGVPPGVMFS